MYFNFEDYRPDTPTLPRPLTRLEGVLLTIVVYLSLVILLLVWPNLPFVKAMEAKRQQQLVELEQKQLERQRENARFVFIAPKVDMKAPKPPDRGRAVGHRSAARTVERAERADQRHAVRARQHVRSASSRAPSRETQPAAPQPEAAAAEPAGAPGHDAARCAVGAPSPGPRRRRSAARRSA